MKMKSLPRFNLAIMSILAFRFVSKTACPSPAVFTLDNAQSTITISGNAAGNNFQEQGPGSLTTKYGGKINADLSDSNIRFTGSSAIDAQTNGMWSPKPGGAAGTAPADYGAQATTVIGSIKAALREIVMDVTSGPLAIANGTFDSSGLRFEFPTNSAASFDFNAGFAGSGSRPLSGLSTNKVVNGATLTTAGDVQRLLIQIDTEFKFRTLAPDDSVLHLNGQLVGTRIIPPIISSIVVTNQTVTLTVDGVAGVQYRLESSTDLKSWVSRAANVTSQSGRFVFSTPAAGTTEFFRIAR